MKRIITQLHITVAIAATLLTSCSIEGSSSKRPDSLGTWIWYSVNEDLNRVNEILILADNFNTYLTLEGEEQEEFYNAHFTNYDINHEGEVYTLTHRTSYDTTITTTIAIHDGIMELQRSGGSSYKLTIKPYDDDLYEAIFEELNYKESTGEARFIVGMETIAECRMLNYIGSLTMVDSQASTSKPLTMTTEITKTLVYNTTMNIYEQGLMHIDCYDKRFGSHDEVDVYIEDGNIHLTIFDQTEIVR